MFNFFKPSPEPLPEIEVQVDETFESVDEEVIPAGTILSGKLSQDGDSHICHLDQYPGYFLEVKETEEGRWTPRKDGYWNQP